MAFKIGGRRTEWTVVNELSWFWIGLQVTVPPVVCLLAAFPFWRNDAMIFGNLAGTAVIFGSAFGLIMREYVELDRAVQRCLDAGFACFPDPGAFTRFAIYAFIGLAEAMALFSLSLWIEKRRRRRGYSPEWR